MERTTLTAQEKTIIKGVIREKTGYLIGSSLLLNQLFRRSSLAAELGETSNEVLEFIGDDVLSHYVTKRIAARCGAFSLTKGYAFRIRENRFTQIEQHLVNNQTLASIMDDWGLARYLLLGKSDIHNRVADEPKVKADLLEAIIGGIAVSCNWDAAVLEQAVSQALNLDAALDAMIQEECALHNVTMDSAVTVLKELAEKGRCSMPTYTFSGPEFLGYDQDGNPRWGCTCRTTDDNTGYTKGVLAVSKKDAKKAAAYLILCALLELPNEYGPSHHTPAWIYKNGNLTPDLAEYRHKEEI